MGGSGSTRRVVIEESNENITITEDVARRIRGEADLPQGAPKGREQAQRPKGPHDAEFENFYANKLKELEERNAQIHRTSVEQFSKAVKDVEKKFMKSTGSPVCQDLQEKVFKCYTENPKATLNCSLDVRLFSDCVERARQNALLKKG